MSIRGGRSAIQARASAFNSRVAWANHAAESRSHVLPIGKPHAQSAESAGNPGGSPEAARKALNKSTILEMHRAFNIGGRKAIEKVMKQQPAVFLKLLVLLVPREMEVTRSGTIKSMSDEQIEAAIEAIQGMLAAREAGSNAKVIEGVAEPQALPAPDVVPDGPNKVMDAADTAVGARERKPRKRVPSPTST
jgi:hypothetical protein